MRLTVNGAEHDLTAPAHETLLGTLRDRLQLTGTKLVCGRGECGACTVLLDGVSVYSCLTLTVACDERAVTTIEGVGHNDALHPVQAAFIQHDALQCGFCTPARFSPPSRSCATSGTDRGRRRARHERNPAAAGPIRRSSARSLRAVKQILPLPSLRVRMTKRFVTTKVEIEGREETKTVELPSRSPEPGPRTSSSTSSANASRAWTP